MTVGVIVATAIAGSVLLLGGLSWLIIRVNRSFASQASQGEENLTVELSRRGWGFEERNDSYAKVFNAQSEFQSLNLLDPFAHPPEAVGAQRVITGVHRGRPFLAALFDVRHQGEHVPVRAIWVRTPGVGPGLTVTRVVRAQSYIRSRIGQADLQLGVPEFDDLFEITTEDERFVRSVMTPNLVQFLVSDSRAAGGFALYGDHLNAHDKISDHCDPAQLIAALDLRCDILDRIPVSAWA